ncbi:REF/SRPP-like protein At1g67360 [Gastrolobium bilobum]|uniref:REF/SRPP-like protein At1g67360 n=1 Tax=Gastrolobium bilobum TaxID=150636 RepID=UPI002AB2EBBD|nr:REF/SRPP-like protein At1g67360 [Gastrolobium bilobum]
MATSEKEVASKILLQELKHLGFVKIAAIQAFICVSSLYGFAKQNSGPLRSAVGTVESTVTTVLGPVYDKIKGVPDHLLVFVDNKVDKATHKFDEHAPPLVKQVVSQVKFLIQELTPKAEKVVSEAQSGGARAAAHYVATESKQFVLIGLVKLWAGLNHYPPFHAVAEMAVPTVAHWSEKYNHVVKNMIGKGYNVFGYLPLIPIDDIAVIAKAFRQGEAAGQESKSFDSGSD